MRVHGTSGGSGRRRERRFGGSSSLFRPTTGTPTGCELLVACDDAALIHGVKVEPMLKLEKSFLVLNQIQEESTRIYRKSGVSPGVFSRPPRPPNATSQSLAHPTSFFARALPKSPTSSAMSPETRDAGSRDIPGDGWSAGTGGIFTFARSRCAQFSPRRRGRVRGGAVLAVLLSAGGANAASVSVGRFTRAPS